MMVSSVGFPCFPTTTCPTPCRIHASPLLVFLLVLAAGFWLFQLLRSVCNLFSYWDIQVFYREALHISPVSYTGMSALPVGRRGGELGVAQRRRSEGRVDGRTRQQKGQGLVTPALDPE